MPKDQVISPARVNTQDGFGRAPTPKKEDPTPMPNQVEIAEACLKALGMSQGDIPRYRSASFNPQVNTVIITAKLGGKANRALYQNIKSRRKATPDEFDAPNPPRGPWIDDLKVRPDYVNDRDVPAIKGQEAAYAEFTFKLNAEAAAKLKAFIGEKA